MYSLFLVGFPSINQGIYASIVAVISYLSSLYFYTDGCAKGTSVKEALLLFNGAAGAI